MGLANPACKRTAAAPLANVARFARNGAIMGASLASPARQVSQTVSQPSVESQAHVP